MSALSRSTAAALIALALLAGDAQAQRPDGLELSLDGARTYVVGQPHRLFATVYSIRAGELQPAAGATVRVLLAHDSHEAALETRSGARGQVQAELVFGEDAPAEVGVIVDVRYQGVQRSFDLTVSARSSNPLTLMLAQPEVSTGSPLVAIGRLLREPSAGETVRLLWLKGREVLSEQTVVLNGRVFARQWTPPAPGRYNVRALIGSASAAAQGEVSEPASQPFNVRVDSPPLARSGQRVRLSVAVRDIEGLPIEAARVRGPRLPNAENECRTDARGECVVEWIAASSGSPSVSVRVAGFESQSARAAIRVDDAAAHLAARPEGGVLVPGAPSYIYVHAVAPDGSALADRTIRVSGSRFDPQSATTDQDGVARVEVTTREGGAVDRCGGSTAVAANLQLEGAEGETVDICLPVDPDATLRVRGERRADALEITLARARRVRGAPVLVDVFHMENAGAPRDAIARLRVTGNTVRIPEASLTARSAGIVELRARPLVRDMPVRGDLTWVLAPAAAEPEAVALVVDAATAAMRRFDNPSTPHAFASRLATQIPRDIGAPFVLRGGQTVAMPLPEDAEALGILRDAVRQQARFETGRLGLVFRGVEQYVQERGIRAITHEAGGRLRFNETALRVMMRYADLGPEGNQDLGGRPLNIASLRSMAPSFDFDHVAARVTRERMHKALMATRQLVDDRDLDMSFARRGSPNDWWQALRDEFDVTYSRDAWGTPLRFVRTRTPTTDVHPVEGWTLTSAGPDRRFGSRDDMNDPTARVLPAGSLYARAMGEDALLAELQGVTLARLLLGETEESTSEADAGGFPLPTPMVPQYPHRTRLQSESTETFEGAVVLRLGFDDQRMTSTRSAMPASSEVRLTRRLPTRLREGEELRVPLTFIGGPETSGPVSLVVSTRGVQVGERERSLTLHEHDAARTTLRLNATETGIAFVRLELKRGPEVLYRSQHRIRVEAPGVERRRHAARLVRGGQPWRVRYDVPARARVRVSLSAPNRAFADTAVHGASRLPLRLWADVMAGREPTESQLQDLEHTELTTPLQAACALLVWAAMEPSEGDARYRRNRDQARQRLGRRGGQPPELLAALASVAPPRRAGSERRGPENWLTGYRERLRGDLHTRAIQARMAAALLLADREDRAGYTALQRAHAAEEGEPLTEFVLQFADHLAGRDSQVSDDWLRRLRTLVDHHPSAAFWHVAASTHGALGDEQPADAVARIEAEGQEHALRFSDGAATYEFEADSEVALTIHSEDDCVARVEAVYRIPETERSELPLSLTMLGDVGDQDTPASWTLQLRATEALEPSVVAVDLPAGVRTDALERALRGVEKVSSIEFVHHGRQLRIAVRSLEAGEALMLPLPLQWTGAGTRTGLSVAVWKAGEPWAVSSVPAREMAISGGTR